MAGSERSPLSCRPTCSTTLNISTASSMYNPMKCLFFFLAVFLLFPFVNAQAQSICSNGNGIASDNTTTVGRLDLKPAMQGIAYQACNSGDANTNNTVTVQYRQTGTGTFFTVSTTINGQLINPFNDRRATINGVSNRYYQQFRGRSEK